MMSDWTSQIGACAVTIASVAVVAIYVFKPWGVRSWYKNVVSEKKRLRKLAMERLKASMNQGVDVQRADRRNQIVAMSFEVLRTKLQKGELTAAEAVDAFRWKAMEVHEKFNCLTEFVLEAPENADELDTKFRNRPKPPLFGMPFSVKDNFWMEGYESSRGLAKEIDVKMEETNGLVAHLQSLGAIPIVRTCVPQTVLQYMCSSPVYGTTCHPLDVTRTPGGSSGGEACLVSAGGVPFGIGSDLGGSLRIPAHFCGLTTIKPGGSRLVSPGAHPGVPGACRLGLSYGFFTKDVATLDFLMGLTITKEYAAHHPPMAPVAWGHDKESVEKKSSLRIGYFEDDGFFVAVPSCRRAVKESKDKLEQLGHHLVQFKLPRPQDALAIFIRCISPDNGAYVQEILENEEIDGYIKPAAALIRLPVFLRRLLSTIVGPFWPEMSLVAGSYNKSVSAVRENYAAADKYYKDFMKEWGTLDALICPAFPFPAIQHEYPPKLMAAAFITGLFNLLDLPAGVLPVTKVTEEDEKETEESYPSKSAVESSMFGLRYPLHQMVRQGTKGSAGLPVGVQVISLPFQEEMAMRVMKLLESNRSF